MKNFMYQTFALLVYVRASQVREPAPGLGQTRFGAAAKQ